MHVKRKGLLVVVSLAIAAFVIIYFALHSTKNYKTTNKQTATSPIDIRPAIIAKFQSLVKSGSDSLYDLSIEKIQPDALSSTLDVVGAKLTPNAAVLQHLDSLQKAPDDIFTVSLDSLHIKGINIDDLLHTSHIDLDSILIFKPVITCNHQPKPYNQLQRAKEQKQTLYQKLTAQVKSINIQSIIIKQCTYVSKQKTKKEKVFNDVTIQVNNLQIDSSTQYDKQRVLFSKQVNISCNNFITRTADSLYLVKINSVQINATDHYLVANQIEVIPRGTKEQFEKKLKYQDNRFNMLFPKVIAKNIDWWSLTNNESFSCDEMQAYNASIKDYIDRSLPTSASNDNIKDFPPQLLMEVPIKINVKKLLLYQCYLSYEEFNPNSNKNGSVTFNNVNGTITNISNIPAVMKTYGHTLAEAKSLFMNTVPLNSSFSFDLTKYKTGNFSLHMSIGSLDKDVLNPIAEPLGLFTIKRGTITTADTKMTGDNYTSNVNLVMLYNDLHLTPLKKDEGLDTSAHKKPLVSFFANVFVIKNANPAHGDDPRNVQTTVKRNPSESFFGFVWKSILRCILKTIGLPEKYAGKR